MTIQLNGTVRIGS